MIYILPRLREPATLFNAKANYLNTLCEFVLTLTIRSTFDVFSRMLMVASNAFFVHGFSMCIYFYYFPLSSSLVTNTSPKSSLIFFLQQNDRCTLLPDFMGWASPILHGWSFVSYLGDVFFYNDRFLESIRGQCRPQLAFQEQHFSSLHSFALYFAVCFLTNLYRMKIVQLHNFSNCSESDLFVGELPGSRWIFYHLQKKTSKQLVFEKYVYTVFPFDSYPRLLNSFSFSSMNN